MDNDDMKYCDTHKTWSNLWVYESEVGEELCQECMKDYWDRLD